MSATPIARTWRSNLNLGGFLMHDNDDYPITHLLLHIAIGAIMWVGIYLVAGALLGAIR